MRNISTSSVSSPGHSNTSSSDKIIRALYNYQAQSPNELSFIKGTIFHVVSEESEWYEALNPSDNTRGMVPRNYFEFFGRTRPASLNNNSNQQYLSQGQLQSPKLGSLYAVVLYDFRAEKTDELTAYAGENIFICAHHNYEWFIAKPIGRLGGPGLVPVSYVNIIDIVTGCATGNDVREDIDLVKLPSVQEWKSKIAKYKASNIALVPEEQQSNIFTQHQMYLSYSSLVILQASVDSFFLENEKYWFEVTCRLSNGVSRILKRYYEDFYDLQVNLLDSFPREAGKLKDNRGQSIKRIIPYIPGPVPYVTDSITKKRMDDLNLYVKELISLPRHISGSELVNSLFSIRNNQFDRESSIDVSVEVNNMASGLTTDLMANYKQEDEIIPTEDLKLYKKLSTLSLTNKPTVLPPASSLPQVKSTKIKFYYKDDIFALLLDPDISFIELREKIAPRIDTIHFRLFVTMGEEIGDELISDVQVTEVIQKRLKITVLDS